MAQLRRPLLEVDVLALEVEGVVGHHLEKGEVLTSLPHVVDVVEPDTGLGDHQGVGGRFGHPLQNPGLEGVDGRLGVEDVISPASHDGVPPHPLVAPLLEEPLEGLPHGGEVQLLPHGRVAYEAILLARGLPAVGVVAAGPVVPTTGGTLAPDEVVLLEEA